MDEAAMPFSPDMAELRLLAELANIPAGRMAAGFNDPEHLFNHISLYELALLKQGCDRIAELSQDLASACDIYTKAAKEMLEASGE
jgi:hypothetical protein